MKKRPEIMSIVLLLFALSVMIVLLGEMRKRLPQPEQTSLAFPDTPRYGVTDTLYYDWYYHFYMYLPNRSWQFTAIPHDTIKGAVDTTAALLPQIRWAANLFRIEQDTIVTTRVGIMPWPHRVRAKELAISLLDEIIRNYERGDNERIRIIIPVTGPAHHLLSGFYFVIVLPQQAKVKRPVWIYSVLPRGKLAYILVAKTTEEIYPKVRDDIRASVGSFTPISFTRLSH